MRESIESYPNYLRSTLLLLIFEENGNIVVLSPSLGLSAYGRTEEDALTSFQYILGTFFNDFTGSESLDQELERLGWNRLDHHFNHEIRKEIIRKSAPSGQFEEKKHTFQTAVVLN